MIEMKKNVVVVGAGPVGLLCALQLAKNGIPVTVIEAEPELTIDLRAGTFHPPTLEMLDPIGVTDAMMPGKLTYGSSGNGAINHLAGHLFGSMAGIKLLHVPYKGGAPAAAAVLSGEVDILFGEPSTVLQFVNTGKLRALATSSDRRSVNLPDMPTIAEAGLPGYAVTSWNGILAPKGTPEPIITRLNKEFNKVLADKEMQSRLIKIGYEPVGGPAENFSKHIASETLKWGPIIKESGLKLN